MTTIAYRNGILAADKQATDGGIICKCTKLFTSNGHAIGVSGTLAFGIAFVKWFQGTRTSDCPLDEHTYALVMNLKTGECEEWEQPGIGIPVEAEFEAIGNGAGLAMGAMEMGADARKAVEVASKWSAYSGFGVQVIKMSKLQKRSEKTT